MLHILSSGIIVKLILVCTSLLLDVIKRFDVGSVGSEQLFIVPMEMVIARCEPVGDVYLSLLELSVCAHVKKFRHPRGETNQCVVVVVLVHGGPS